MPRSCTVCAHPDATEINEAVVIERQSSRAITRQFGLHHDAVRRHRQHIPQLLSKASEALEVVEADTLLDRLEALQRRTENTLDEVEGTDNYTARLGAIREMRRNLELIGEVTKELNRTPTLNLEFSPEWIELQALIITSLEPHPDARDSVLAAIRSVNNGAS